ncbi:hypothetical protein EYF80_032205 [Liparis tanakae]|uniref:Uncharacterized protein n=1 Tax=Liparis tanakae TaxID=230148 RepID=A0A4Z2GXV8_9TELE|nr:hypothetical protein EYF80_032205 [Liparis tanakae]
MDRERQRHRAKEFQGFHSSTFIRLKAGRDLSQEDVLLSVLRSTGRHCSSIYDIAVAIREAAGSGLHVVQVLRTDRGQLAQDHLPRGPVLTHPFLDKRRRMEDRQCYHNHLFTRSL